MISCFYRLPGLGIDGQTYLQIARNIHYGIGLGWQALWFPPLHSILIALVAWLPGAHDLLTAASIVAVVMGLLLTVSVYFLSATVFGRTVAVITTIVVLSFPHVFNLHFSSEAELTYTTFLVASLTLLLSSVRNGSFPMAILTGVSFSLAYLSRSEGFLIMVFTLAVLCFTQGIHFYKTVLAKLCLTVIVVFFIVSAPYLHFLHKHYDAFVISPKATYVMIWMKSRIYHDNNKGETTNEDLWGLTPEGKLKWQQPTGIRDLFEYLMSNPSKSLAVYLHNLSEELPGRIPNSSGTQHFPQVYPVYVALIAAIAAFWPWGEASALKKVVLFAPLFILFVLPVFTGGWCKYLTPYAPLLMIAAGGGLFMSIKKVTARFSNPHLRKAASIAPFVILTILSTNFISLILQKPPVSTNINNISRKDYTERSREAALMARKTFGPGKNYMVQWNKMIYYLDGLWTPEPIANHGQMLDFARKNNVDYLIWEYFDRQMSDEELANAPPDLKLQASIDLKPASTP
jgi:4-amino-4-deoxy-L-arabinose transferase-like glycosyltransferase